MFEITVQCNACGACVDYCPVDKAIREGTPYYIDPELCAECGACLNECPQQAIIDVG